MNAEKEIQNAFAQLKKRGVETFIVQVTEVQKDKGTCTVTDGKLEYTDVQLSAVVNSDKQKLFIFPKKDSKVLVSPISEDLHHLYVEVVSEVESITGTIGETEFTINEKGYNISREGENLQKVLSDFMTEFGKLCDELNNVVVSIGVTPNVPVITVIKKTVETTIKKRLNTILITE